MPLITQCIEVAALSKRNQEWMADDFFHRPVTLEGALHLAEHYRDVAANNTVCSDEERTEFARRARYLKYLAAKLARSKRVTRH
jgi:hypothetical protein